MFTKTISDLKEQQSATIFAILDMVKEGTDVKFFVDSQGKRHIRITEQDGTVHLVSGSSSRDVFAQACQVLP
jgi:hypothetical protein